MSQQKIIMCKGLPASGKSTWAKQYIVEHNDFLRVNNDELTLMLYNKIYIKNRKALKAAREAAEESILRSGRNLISDNTNLRLDHLTRYQFLAEMFDAKFEIKDFTDISVNECLLRDKQRENPVGEEVILDMFYEMLKHQEKIPYNTNLWDAIVCDLDGTLALHKGKRGPYEDEKCEIDDVNMNIFNLLKTYAHNPIEKNYIIFVSGRDEGRSRQPTINWLFNKCNFNIGPMVQLYMRPAGDLRPDWKVKREIYEQNIKGKYNVLFVLDDRDQVVREWRGLGLNCWQVNYGNF